MTDDKSKIVEDIFAEVGWDDEYTGNYREVQDDRIYIIGLDPGETTGFAVVRIDPKDKKALPELLFLDQVPDGRYGFKEYFKNFWLDDLTIVVSEKWKERNKKGVDREPQYIEGSMHMLWGDEYINYQYPEVKSLVPDEFLIEQGVWTPGKRHQMDALIHILVFLRNGGAGNEGVADALGGEGGGQTMGEISDYVEGDGQGDESGIGKGFDSFGDKEGEANGVGNYEIDEANPDHGTQDGGNQNGYGVAGTVKLDGERSKRDLDGAFMGFASKELDEGKVGSTLLDD